MCSVTSGNRTLADLVALAALAHWATYTVHPSVYRTMHIII